MLPTTHVYLSCDPIITLAHTLQFLQPDQNRKQVSAKNKFFAYIMEVLPAPTCMRLCQIVRSISHRFRRVVFMRACIFTGESHSLDGALGNELSAYWISNTHIQNTIPTVGFTEAPKRLHTHTLNRRYHRVAVIVCAYEPNSIIDVCGACSRQCMWIPYIRVYSQTNHSHTHTATSWIHSAASLCGLFFFSYSCSDTMCAAAPTIVQ